MIRFLGPALVYPFAEKYVKRDISSKILKIQSARLLSPQERHEKTLKDLVSIFEFAKAKVPYYRDVLGACSFEPARLAKDIGYLQDVPLLSKEIIREQGDRLISDDHRQNPWLHKRSTGGSTGQSVIIKYAQEDLDWTAAVNLSLSYYTGRKAHHLEVHLAARFEEPTTLVNRCYGVVKNVAMNRRNIFVREFDDSSLSSMYWRLRWMRPFIVQGHPSTVFALSSYVERVIGHPVQLFKALESTGEAIDGEQVRHIERFLGCKVFNRYGSAEFGVVAHSHTDPFRLEVIESMAFPETVRTAEGASELVLTGLRNFAMPLLRYQTGDLADVSKEAGKYFLQRLEGRIHDLVRIQGKVVATHYLQDVLDRVGLHREFQILFDSKTKEVRRILVVPLEGHVSSKPLENEILTQLGVHIPVEFVGFDGLRRVGIRDKFRRALPDVLEAGQV